MEEMR